MEIVMKTKHELTPEEMANALAQATPKEFAKFWFSFSEACSDDSLDEFAKAMAPSLGSNRKRPLIELVGLMKYYEVKEKKESD